MVKAVQEMKEHKKAIMPINLKHLLLNHSASIATTNKRQVIGWSKKRPTTN
jgi:hypothetical protein